jgi:hypothetical protein
MKKFENMKKLLITLAFSIAFVLNSLAQPNFEIRIVKTSFDYLEVQIRQTVAGQSPTTAKSCTDISFSVRWSTTADLTFDYDGNNNVVCVINGNLKTVGTRFTSGSYYYYKFYTESVFTFPTNWTDNVWEKICRIKINSTGSGVTDFEIGPNNWAGAGTTLNIGVNLTDYAMTLVGPAASTVPYPSATFNYVWRGGQTDATHDGNSWDYGANWLSVCDVPLTNPPTNAQNVVVPVVTSNQYPANVKTVFDGTETQPVASAVLVKNGANIRIPASEVYDDYNGVNFWWLYTFVTLSVEDGGHVYVSAGGRLTVNGAGLGSIKLYGASGIVLESGLITTDPGGLNGGPFEYVSQASLLDQQNVINVQYMNTGANVKAQTFITHPTGGDDPFYVHMVGPRLDDPNTAYLGVPLGWFNMTTLQTYSYYYNEPTNAWMNIYSLTTPVPALKGIILSNSVANDDMFEMTGQIIESDFLDTTGLSVTAGQGLGWHMFNNPFAASLDLNLFRTDNNTRIGTTFQIYNPSAGVYGTWVTSTSTGTNGVTKYVQPGQGFFAQALSNATYARFQDGRRFHQNTAFLKSEDAYTMRVKVSGYSYYSDESVIRFAPEGTPYFDAEYDGEKWQSMMENATEIWTISNDQTALAINSMPTLGSAMVSVPLFFECHGISEYTFKFSQLNSFDPGTQIYLEDLVTGGEWYDLTANSTYTFNGNPDDQQNRFIIHFFGPTGIGDPDAGNNAIQIYSWGHDAYIVNRGTETVKEYIAYDMMGRELHRGTLPNSTVNKVTIGDASAYYIVKVITKEGRIYTDKVYITK